MIDTLARPQVPWALRLVPPFPTIAQRILSLAGQEHVNTAQVSELVKLDPSFSAELLRFANSAIFGARGEVTSVAHAIVMLGIDRVKSMATFVAMNSMVRCSLRLDVLRKVWTHSFITALIAGEAGRGLGIDSETAYTTGLLHNLGTLGLMAAYPEEYSRMLRVSNDFGFDLLRTERDLFEIDHCTAGAYLAQDWNFPDDMAAAIALHHEEPVPGEATLENLIKLSWRITDSLGFAAFSPEKNWAFDELSAFLSLTRNSWLADSPESVRNELIGKVAAAT